MLLCWREVVIRAQHRSVRRSVACSHMSALAFQSNSNGSRRAERIHRLQNRWSISASLASLCTLWLYRHAHGHGHWSLVISTVGTLPFNVHDAANRVVEITWLIRILKRSGARCAICSMGWKLKLLFRVGEILGKIRRAVYGDVYACLISTV